MEVDKTSRAYMLPSKGTEYETPRDLFAELSKEWGEFDLDPCCQRGQYTAECILLSGGHVCVPDYPVLPRTEEDDWYQGLYKERIHRNGLTFPWFGKVYMNPPYGREIGKWVEKAVHEVREGDADLVVALLPSRTGTKWWQQYVLQGMDCLVDEEADAVQFLPGRLKFEGEKASAPFDSAVVAWWTEEFHWRGWRGINISL